MNTENQSQTVRSEVLRSPSLYLKEFEATEEVNIREYRYLSGTRIKAVLAPFMYWAIRHVPKWLALLPIRLLVFVLGLLYVWSNNPFRQSCEYICRLASDAGFAHRPKVIYSQLLRNALGTVDGYFHLYRDGIDSVIDSIALNSQDADRINRLAKEYDA